MASALALAIAAGPALAVPDARRLHWNLLDVDARLDAAGDLHVVELQEMVFTGDWNGGERAFHVGRGQRLRLERVLRVAADGEARPLAQGSLDGVDRWAWADAGHRTLRWRSRLPSDPPFDSTAITYVLEYTLSGVVQREGEGFRLAHDFAFAERPGPILEVRARLALDPSWEASVPLALERTNLPPGEGAVLDVPLRWVAAGAPPTAEPAAARAGPRAFPASLRLPLLGALVAALALAAGWVWRHGSSRGFFDPIPEREVDERWLREHVLVHAPEVVGAAWDDRVGAPEVSAVLARLAAERKVAPRLDRGALFGKVLHLQLLVDRSTLHGYDRKLVDGLFFDGDTTDTRSLRAHYKGRGFDPSSRISEEVRAKARALVPSGTRGGRRGWLGGAALLAIASSVIGWIAVARAVDPAEIGPPAFAGTLLFVLAAFFAARLSTSVARRAVRAAASALPLLLWMAGICWLAWGAGGTSLPAVLSHVALWGAAVVYVAGLARTPLSEAALTTRRRLEAARRNFARELARSEPALADEWIPYLVALGLGGDLDRWVRVHGARAPAALARTGTLARTATGSGAGAAPWTGGGGRFSGGGASGTWAALGSFSAGISAPSSSGSRGGSSGGSSSGGGGGGGW